MLDAKIAFREVGTGPLVVLLHGYAGSVLHWDPVVEVLSQSFRVVIPNLTHLYTGKEMWTFSQQTELFAAFLQKHFPGEMAHLVGISYGAALAWGVGLRNPEHVSKTTFINPMPPDPVSLFRIPVLKSIFRLPVNMRALYLILRTPVGRFFLKRAAEVFRTERADMWKRVDDLHGRKLLFVCHVINKFAFILKNENWHLWKQRLETWTHPALLIYDFEDPLFEPKTYHHFQDLIGCEETLSLHEAGHIAIQTQGPKIAKAVSEFFQTGTLSKKSA